MQTLETDVPTAETIDFDITTATINPQYALPYARGFIREIILRRDEKIAKLAFNNMPDLLKFQQAVTGFKAFLVGETGNRLDALSRQTDCITKQ